MAARPRCVRAGRLAVLGGCLAVLGGCLAVLGGRLAVLGGCLAAVLGGCLAVVVPVAAGPITAGRRRGASRPAPACAGQATAGA